jgi:hypothetical protein
MGRNYGQFRGFPPVRWENNCSLKCDGIQNKFHLTAQTKGCTSGAIPDMKQDLVIMELDITAMMKITAMQTSIAAGALTRL